MKKSIFKIEDILAMPIGNLFLQELPKIMEDKNEKTVLALATKSILGTFYGGGSYAGITIERFLQLEPIKIKIECALSNESYGKMSHDLLRNFFISQGMFDTTKYPFLKELVHSDEVTQIRKNLRNRSHGDLQKELNPNNEGLS